MSLVRLALVGDVLLTRDLRAEADDGLAAVAAVLRDADCAIANLELPLHDFTSPASVAPGGMWLGAAPERAGDLAWLGIGAVSRANNHACDYGIGGLHQTDRALAAAGVVSAGTGDDLAAARRACYVETAAGVVALVSCTATFPLSSMAGAARPPVPGRPGVSPLRRLGRRLVEPAEALARLGVPLPELRAGRTQADVAGLRDMVGTGGDPAGVAPGDAAEVLTAVADARANADAVVVAIHAHDQGASEADPSPGIADFSRRCIDAGADVVAGHGPHVVRGVEMHAGRPILHGLGNFVFQPETVPHLPEDAYRMHGLGPEADVAHLFATRWRDGGFAARPAAWQGLVAVVTLAAGRARVECLPVDLRRELGPRRRGTPRLVGVR